MLDLLGSDHNVLRSLGETCSSSILPTLPLQNRPADHLKEPLTRLHSDTIDKRQKTESYIVERRWMINAQETNVRMGSTLQVLVSQKHFCKLVWPTFNFVNWIILVEALQKLCSGPAAKKSAWKRCQNIWPTHHSGFQLHATGIQHWHLVPLHWHGWPRAEETQLLWLEPTFH